MKRLLFILFSVFAAMAADIRAQGIDMVIPVPEEVIYASGTYRFKDSPKITFKKVGTAGMKPEAYRLEVQKNGVVITSSDEAGAFYAQQTLAQMISENDGVKELQCCVVNDCPRFVYRGLHFDVSRHFRSLDFLKKQVDAMALYKMNRMHIHLTDAAGWRLEIESYPRLMTLAAWRSEHRWKDWWYGDRKYVEQESEGSYGGYYTKDEMRELVEYARQKHIEVIPEIEMPGHSEEVLAAYPELSCKGAPYSQGEFCVGNEDTFRFLEAVLDEVMDVFPSEMIHIGGDEANKAHWKECPKCRKRMEEEGLEEVDELQSYMIKRISRFVESRGRRIVGWDEILDGGLAPGAAVMSWRGEQGGIEAISMGHDVIMTPGRYCYLDHTQDAPFKEPESIGGYLPLDSVYVYDPASKMLRTESSGALLGIQGNLWSEYVVTDSHAEYMYWPRALAIAETGWSRPDRKNLEDFRRRAMGAVDRLESMGYETFDLKNEYGERKLAQTGLDHKAKGCKVVYSRPIQEWYPAAGETTFTDGIIGGWTYSDQRWQGFLSDIDVTIDLGSVQTVSYVGGTFMQLKEPGVFMPQKVDIYVSADGDYFELVAEVWNDVSVNIPDLLFRSFDTICDVRARYVRYHAKRSTMRGFLFLDEIVVN